ncbi:MAG: flagellar motor switch phosphatase FliY [Lachnospiraceae bacterium]|nr:flagellar motor switch phosphatase FliY [Lachnospiraceae bacterium]
MDGMLSQDEINALLSGMAADGDGADASSGAADTAPAAADGAGAAAGGEEELTEFEKDAIGEVANISMGTSATTLYSLVNRKVDITTPEVTMSTWSDIVENYEKPCVFIQIHYKVGLDGYNMLILKEDDVKIITDLMMGGDGTGAEGELSDLHLSAISEAMNQMMGSSATSLSSMLGRMIDISPPEASLVDLTEGNPGDYAEFLMGRFVKISFRMQIGDLVDSTIMQLYPVSFAKELYDHFIGSQEVTPPSEPEPAAPEPAAAPPPQQAPPPMADPGMAAAAPPPQQMGYPGQAPPQMGYGVPQMGYGAPPMGYGQPAGAPVNVQQAQFTTFSNDINPMQPQENIDLIKDVPLEVTVELGRTRKSINDILDFSPGTIIELDKIAGEPIDVLVNGKNVAKGEVVVIDESFGVRVTEIIK